MVVGFFVIIILLALGIYIFILNPVSRDTPATVTTAKPRSPPAAIQNVTGPGNGIYLSLSDGQATRLYLMDSGMRYGTFGRDIVWPPAEGGYLAKNGDPCMIINGTIRNDYDSDYFIGLIANAYDPKGEKVGTLVNTGMGDPWHGFTTYHVQSKETEQFEIFLKYNKTDVKSYDIYAAFMPTATAPP